MWLYRKILWLYPIDFRQEYGGLMLDLFDDMLSNRAPGIASLIILWMRILRDTVVSATHEHLQHNGGLSMKPEKIDQYEIKALLGEGSIASVYLAYDSENQHEVALKLLNEPTETLDRATQIIIMRREANVLQSLDHPGIVRVQDFNESDEHIYLVMELVPGKSALSLLEENGAPLPEAQLTSWAIQLCDILGYVHDHNFVFRDVKPGNIMIDNDTVCLLDWGIAENYVEKQEFAKVGTEGYAPPEQYKGGSDPRSDIFALGATLHHLATNIDPRQQEPFRFRYDDPCTVNPNLSKPFGAVITTAVQFEADDRFQTVSAMKTALEACRAG